MHQAVSERVHTAQDVLLAHETIDLRIQAIVSVDTPYGLVEGEEERSEFAKQVV